MAESIQTGSVSLSITPTHTLGASFVAASSLLLTSQTLSGLHVNVTRASNTIIFNSTPLANSSISIKKINEINLNTSTNGESSPGINFTGALNILLSNTSSFEFGTHREGYLPLTLTNISNPSIKLEIENTNNLSLNTNATFSINFEKTVNLLTQLTPTNEYEFGSHREGYVPLIINNVHQYSTIVAPPSNISLILSPLVDYTFKTLKTGGIHISYFPKSSSNPSYSSTGYTPLVYSIFSSTDFEKTVIGNLVTSLLSNSSHKIETNKYVGVGVGFGLFNLTKNEITTQGYTPFSLSNFFNYLISYNKVVGSGVGFGVFAVNTTDATINGAVNISQFNLIGIAPDIGIAGTLSVNFGVTSILPVATPKGNVSTSLYTNASVDTVALELNTLINTLITPSAALAKTYETLGGILLTPINSVTPNFSYDNIGDLNLLFTNSTQYKPGYTIVADSPIAISTFINSLSISSQIFSNQTNVLLSTSSDKNIGINTATAHTLSIINQNTYSKGISYQGDARIFLNTAAPLYTTISKNGEIVESNSLIHQSSIQLPINSVINTSLVPLAAVDSIRSETGNCLLILANSSNIYLNQTFNSYLNISLSINSSFYPSVFNEKYISLFIKIDNEIASNISQDSTINLKLNSLMQTNLNISKIFIESFNINPLSKFAVGQAKFSNLSIDVDLDASLNTSLVYTTNLTTYFTNDCFIELNSSINKLINLNFSINNELDYEFLPNYTIDLNVMPSHASSITATKEDTIDLSINSAYLVITNIWAESLISLELSTLYLGGAYSFELTISQIINLNINILSNISFAPTPLNGDLFTSNNIFAQYIPSTLLNKLTKLYFNLSHLNSVSISPDLAINLNLVNNSAASFVYKNYSLFSALNITPSTLVKIETPNITHNNLTLSLSSQVTFSYVVRGDSSVYLNIFTNASQEKEVYGGIPLFCTPYGIIKNNTKTTGTLPIDFKINTERRFEQKIPPGELKISINNDNNIKTTIQKISVIPLTNLLLGIVKLERVKEGDLYLYTNISSESRVVQTLNSIVHTNTSISSDCKNDYNSEGKIVFQVLPICTINRDKEYVTQLNFALSVGGDLTLQKAYEGRLRTPFVVFFLDDIEIALNSDINMHMPTSPIIEAHVNHSYMYEYTINTSLNINASSKLAYSSFNEIMFHNSLFSHVFFVDLSTEPQTTVSSLVAKFSNVTGTSSRDLVKVYIDGKEVCVNYNKTLGIWTAEVDPSNYSSNLVSMRIEGYDANTR